MKRLLRPQDILLLTLGGAVDILEEIRDPFMLAAKAYKITYGFIPRRYKRTNFTKSIYRSLRTGYIEKIEKGGDIYLRLTAEGNEKLQRDFSLFQLSRKVWDGKWRIVFFDIEEVSRRLRNRLREKLRELGFGMLQKSVWITPHDIGVDFYEFIEFVGLHNLVFIIEGKDLLGIDSKALARKAWKLDTLEEAYAEIEEELEKIKQLPARYDDRHIKREDKGLKGEMETRVRRARAKYLQVLLRDPHLPRALLPKDWIGYRVRTALKKFEILAKFE